MLLKTPSDWRTEIHRGGLDRTFRTIYGDDPTLLNKRRDLYMRLLKTSIRVHEDRPVLLVRAPARVNLLGMHIDHQGGHVNHLCIGREILMAAEPRDDDVVTLHNTDPRFSPRTFCIREELPPKKRGHWLNYIEDISIPQGDWGNYIRAAVLRVQDRFADRPLKGMNLVVTGDIPMGTGLSSSSALVIAAMEAILHINQLHLPPSDKIVLSGEGEWYVGTRGGWGDQAAMIYGKRGHIAHIGFFPLTVERIPLPRGYRVVSCNSFVQARKSAGARNTYNSRVAAYRIGLLLIKDLLPEHAPNLVHLRDIMTENLNWPLDRLYELLKALPERITREEAMQRLPSHQKELETLFLTHDEPPEGYRVRPIVLYGLAECERSKMCVDLLRQGDVETFGQLKTIAHNGDRVCVFTPQGKVPYDNHVTDDDLDRLIADLNRGDPDRIASAQLHRQPGGYGCSCEELDQLVDIANAVDGVVGAGLTGAGLGGCILALVREDRVEDLIQALNEQFYAPQGLPSGVEVVSSVDGAGVLGS